MIPSLIAILAISDDDVIGVDGKLPWHLPEDLARFKTKTSGHAIIMGSKTQTSIGRALPNRRNIVVSANRSLVVNGCERALTPLDAVRWAWATDASPYVIGGAQIYGALWGLITRVELTEVHNTYPQDDATCFVFDRSEWIETSRVAASAGNSVEFVTLERA